MTTMVHFRSGGTDYCLPVAATRAVRDSADITALPAPAADIAGIIPGTPPLTVICPLGTSGAQVLVIESTNKIFGLLVDAVTGLRRISDAEINPAPDGQDQPLISGTIGNGGNLILITDPDALAGHL